MKCSKVIFFLTCCRLCFNLYVCEMRVDLKMLYLVSENIDKARAHYRSETGQIVQLMRGVYVDTDDDINTTILRHAIRIAHYLYPRAYLSGVSADLLTPTRDGRLFISGKRNQRTRIRSLEIIQNTAPAHPSIATALISDGMGEFHINVSSHRQRFLEAFRIRSEHAVSIDIEMRGKLAERLVTTYKNAKKAADAVWALARENEWYQEGEQAERYLIRKPVDVRNEAELAFIVAWHNIAIGELCHDGFEWRWQSEQGFDLPLVQQRAPGKLPPFILSLLPEGWLEQILKNRDERALLKSGRRYMSNIIISEHAADLQALPADILTSCLANYSRDGLFTGRYAGPRRDSIEQNFECNLAQLYDRADTPRLSGVQIKAPMSLDGEGGLAPSIGLPFTHILKPAGTSGFQAMPVIEYLSMTLGRHSGLATPEVALVPMPDDMPPALVVERFDIRTSPNDKRRIAFADLCSVLDLTPDDKYESTIEQVARAVRPLSTAPKADLTIILQRALFAWLIADGDMHLKNLGLLKIAQPNTQAFGTVRLAPLYDALTTRVFPGLKHDRIALKVNGKDNRLKRSDFQKLAVTIGLTATTATKSIDAMLEGFRQGLDHIFLPTMNLDEDIARKAEQMLLLCRDRLDQFE